jgi:2-C-methyl-D-erythritol 2,4-cyclodiphosphate synthase
MRIGVGYDVHRLAEGRRLVLGGVEIPYCKGLLGHSDGDVLIHAVSDAILGALSEGDIGSHFPDTDESIKGIESIRILSRVMELATARGFTVVNIDTVVTAQEPKIHPYRETIRETMARVLGVEKERVGVKGKTMEGLGPVGRGEAIEAYAVALLEENQPMKPCVNEWNR